MSQPRQPGRQEEQSLDLVQRVIISTLVIVIVGSISAVLAVYVATPHRAIAHGDAVMLWVMTGVIGLVAAAGVLLVNRKRPYAPWVALGLLPMAISAYWVLK